MTTKYFSIPFANSGDKTSIPDASQPSGSVSFENGWTPDYEKDQATDPDAKDVSRQNENYFKFSVTEALKELQEYGYKPYSDLVNYPVNAVVFKNGIRYECLIANGPASTVVDPVGNPDTWLNLSTQYKGYINGGILSNGSDTNHDIDLTSVSVGMTDGNENYKLFVEATPPTKQIDVNWTEGNNSGGFPSGLTLAANTHYNYFLIGKNDGTVDAGFDTSNTAVNLLADATGYTWYRRILSIFTDGSSNIIQFLQVNNQITFLSTIVDINDASITKLVFETGTLTVPPNQIAILTAAGRVDATDFVRVYVRPTGVSSTNLQKVIDLDAGSNGTYIGASQTHVPTNENSQIEYTNDGSGTAVSVNINTIGWIDDRGAN